MSTGKYFYLKDLNASQLEGVVNVKGPTMIIAGAGSGKQEYLQPESLIWWIIIT